MVPLTVSTQREATTVPADLNSVDSMPKLSLAEVCEYTNLKSQSPALFLMSVASCYTLDFYYNTQKLSVLLGCPRLCTLYVSLNY